MPSRVVPLRNHLLRNASPIQPIKSRLSRFRFFHQSNALIGAMQLRNPVVFPALIQLKKRRVLSIFSRFYLPTQRQSNVISVSRAVNQKIRPSKFLGLNALTKITMTSFLGFTRKFLGLITLKNVFFRLYCQLVRVKRGVIP